MASFMHWQTVAALAGRGAATLAVVALALVLLRRGGEVMAGLVAAFPVTSAPALAWVGVDRGPAFAAQAGLAALFATGLTAIFAAVYGALARRFGRGTSMVLAAAATLMVCLATHGIASDGRAVVPFTLLAFAAAFASLPRATAAPARQGASWRDVAFTAGVSGVLTVAVSATAQNLEAQWCGLIVAIPVVSMTTIFLVHARWPLPNLSAFLRAYVHGLVAKAVFMGTLAVALVPLGLLPGWVAALAAGAATLVLRQSARTSLRSLRLSKRLAPVNP